MFLRSLRRSWPIMIAVTLFLTYCTYYYLTGPLIVPPNTLGFIDRTELMITVIMIPIFAFVLPNKFEIELSLTYGMSTTRLFFSKALSVFIYTVIPAVVFVLLYKYVPYDGGTPAKIPLFVPENFRVYVLVSALITLLFFFSLYAFLRVLTRNCYLPLIVGLFLHFTAESTCKGIQRGLYNIKKSIYDPFISVYFIGDEVPNAIAEKYPELACMANAWTHNRVIFLCLSVVLLAATYLLLRRERLHRGFGD